LSAAVPSVAVADTVCALALAEANVPLATCRLRRRLTFRCNPNRGRVVSVVLSAAVNVTVTGAGSSPSSSRVGDCVVLAAVPPSVAVADTVCALALALAEANVPLATGTSRRRRHLRRNQHADTAAVFVPS
jgi:hypothetical protein